jgi:hypothetical protein
MTHEAWSQSNDFDEPHEPHESNDPEAGRRRVRAQRQAVVERLRRLGQEQGATLIAIRQPPPGASGNPGVYRHDRDGYTFVFFHHKDEVASETDPPELQAGRPWRVSGPYEVLGEWAIGRYDLARRLQEGAVLYTPESYPDLRRYDPTTEPPLIATETGQTEPGQLAR